MNERIRELFSQTALHRNDHTTEQRLYEVEKFAQLLVKEAAAIADKYVRIGDIDIPVIIKRHFGVEK